jgi:hypothetical protein
VRIQVETVEEIPLTKLVKRRFVISEVGQVLTLPASPAPHRRITANPQPALRA